MPSREQLADNVQIIASAMRAGHSFVGALKVVVEEAAEPSRREFQRVVNDERLGKPIEQAFAELAARMRNDELDHLGLVARLQTETGGNTSEVLDRLVETLRARGELRRLVRTLTAQGRLGGWVVGSLPVVLLVALSVLSPDYAAEDLRDRLRARDARDQRRADRPRDCSPSAASSTSRSRVPMILLALFALALVGATVTLLARASALPRIRAARRLDQIAAYGAAGGSIGGERDVAGPP